MLEALLAKVSSIVTGDEVLYIDPSNLAAGATAIVDKSKKAVSITNTGVVVADKGPVTGMKSLYFKASAYSYLTMGYASLPNLLTGDFTIELWWCPESQGSTTAALISQWKQTTGQGGFLLSGYGTGRNFSLGSYNENSALLSGTTGVVNTWEHLAVVREGSAFRLYKNGQLVTSATNTSTRAQLSVNWTLGAYLNSNGVVPQASGSILDGWMAQVRVYQRAKYKANFTPA